MDTYLASEGFLAIQNRLGTNAMQLVYDNGIFFEFVPFNEDNFDTDGKIKNNPQALTINEVEENINYAIVITTCSGAWRYLIGDTVMFKDKERCEIVITGRTKHYLSICGEHLSVGNMTDALKYVEEKLDINVREFTVSGIEKDGKIHHKWYIGCQEPLVSGDFNHNPLSSIFAVNETKVLGGNLVRVMSWYDNEWGFSNRMLDTAAKMHKVGYAKKSEAA